MLAKYCIEYTAHPRTTEPSGTHRSNDPVEAENYLMDLLCSGARILSIKHEGVEIQPAQADRMLKVAGERLLSKLLAHSLDTDSIQIRHRFGLAA